MKIKVEVRGMEEVQRRLRNLSREMQGKALQPAINKVAEKARAEINRAIPGEFAVKASEVRQAIEIRKAGAGRLEAVVSIFGSRNKRGRSMNLIHFLAAVQGAGRAMKVRGAKGKKAELAALERQLGFIIKRGGGLKKIEGAFVGNKGRTIFRRAGRERLPIEPLRVIGFAQMFNSRRISERVMAKLDQDLLAEVDRAIARLLARG